MKLLMTGSTGFLGNFVTQLLDKEEISYKGISRKGDHGYKGNLLSWNLGLNIEQLAKEEFDTFLHMGALYDLRAPRDQVLATNISGTLMALSVARKLKIKNFINISSVAAAIHANEKVIDERDVITGGEFPDAYSESKANTEEMLQNWNIYFQSALNLRLGILVGDTLKGKFQRIDGPYHIPQAFRRMRKVIYHNPLPLPLPGGNTTGAPLVPVDLAAKAIVAALKKVNENSGYRNLHIVPDKPVTIEELYKDSLDFLGLGHKSFTLVNILPFHAEENLSNWIAHMPKEEVHYLMNMPSFKTEETKKFLGEDWCLAYHDYKERFWRGYEAYVQNR